LGRNGARHLAATTAERSIQRILTAMNSFYEATATNCKHKTS
jgi:hypothetical protein